MSNVFKSTINGVNFVFEPFIHYFRSFTHHFTPFLPVMLLFDLFGLFDLCYTLCIDLMSRKEVWSASERKLSSEIKELNLALETKTIVESQLRSELANFRTMMEHAEQRHQMKSPNGAGKLAKRRKRRVSQISSSSVTGMTPQMKKFPKGGNMSTDRWKHIYFKLSIMMHK